MPFPGASGALSPDQALTGLQVYPGLEATLFASEPMIASPTNIDVDERGRVWVCDVMNYRATTPWRKPVRRATAS